jgi:uncharacterized protein YegP (UPF0339 family)
LPEPEASAAIGLWSDNRPGPEFGEDLRCQFRLFQAEWVSLTSTQSDGGDWRWQFCSHSGEILCECAGFRSEAEARAAVLRLQNEAAYATITTLG